MKAKSKPMQYNKLLSVQTIFNEIYKTDKFESMSIQECLGELRADSDYLVDRWIDSNYTDFGIYKSDKYIAEGLLCYYMITQGSVKGLLKYLQTHNPTELSTMTFFDDYNGIGLSSLFLMNQGLDVSFRNDNEFQSGVFAKLCELHNLEEPKLDAGQKYDVVMSFEVAEHFLNPIEYWDILKNKTKENGYLVMATGYGPGNYAGHFKTYDLNGTKISSVQASKKLNEAIKGSGFEEVFKGYNGKPRIFKHSPNQLF